MPTGGSGVVVGVAMVFLARGGPFGLERMSGPGRGCLPLPLPLPLGFPSGSNFGGGPRLPGLNFLTCSIISAL